MPLKNFVAIILGVICLCGGVVGLAGREIRVPVAGGTSLVQRAPSEWRQFSRTEGRLMGGVLLVLGLLLV